MPWGGGTACLTLHHPSPPPKKREDSLCRLPAPRSVCVRGVCAARRSGGAGSPRGADRQPRRSPAGAGPARRPVGALPPPGAIPRPR